LLGGVKRFWFVVDRVAAQEDPAYKGGSGAGQFRGTQERLGGMAISDVQRDDVDRSQRAATPLQPGVLEFLVVFALCCMISFRTVSLLLAPLVLLTFCRCQRSLVRYLVLGALVALFAIPVDVRLAGSSGHHGESSRFAAVVPTFTGRHTAHSAIRRMHS